MTLESGYTNTRHGQIHYRKTGDGPPLVLLHATPKSSRSFALVLQHLAAHHRVIAPDTLGFGESDPLPPHLKIEILAEAMADLIIALNAKPAAVFGLHTGNKIGAALAAGWPELVSHFILCGMTHSIILERSEREAAIKSLVATPFARNNISDDEKRDREQGAASIDAIYKANYGFDLAPVLASVTTPTLVLELATPEEDHLGRQATAVAAQISKAKACTFEGSDRDALEQRPDELAQAILDFTRA
ncbi:MAG: alpha/beta fold hydrolase [Alphaproteobacteria bacterium]|nr:alpha/beta fold hydrolase [Alphaproteobacteria bacterium]